MVTASFIVINVTQYLYRELTFYILNYIDFHYISYLNNWAGRSWFDSRLGLGIFFFDTMSRPAPEPTQPPIQWVPGGSFPGGKAAVA
jgi:hypothetical protein